MCVCIYNIYTWLSPVKLWHSLAMDFFAKFLYIYNICIG